MADKADKNNTTATADDANKAREPRTLQAVYKIPCTYPSMKPGPAGPDGKPTQVLAEETVDGKQHFATAILPMQDVSKLTDQKSFIAAITATKEDFEHAAAGGGFINPHKKNEDGSPVIYTAVYIGPQDDGTTPCADTAVFIPRDEVNADMSYAELYEAIFKKYEAKLRTRINNAMRETFQQEKAEENKAAGKGAKKAISGESLKDL